MDGRGVTPRVIFSRVIMSRVVASSSASSRWTPSTRVLARPRARRLRARATPSRDDDDIVREVALEAQRAKAAVTRRKIAAESARREREEASRLAADAREREEARRERARARAESVGGRAPYHRKPGPMLLAGTATSVVAVASLVGTVTAGDFFSSGVGVAASGLTTLSVGAGLTVTSALCFSAFVLFALAFQETKNILFNEPVSWFYYSRFIKFIYFQVIYYRCDGNDPSCCANGPHNLGYHERFVYLNDGRGYETRRGADMQRHLRVSKGCSALKPLIVYPKEAKWTFW